MEFLSDEQAAGGHVRQAGKGRADTHVTSGDGRAVCFVTGEPSGLAVTLPPALAELMKAAPPGAPIMHGPSSAGTFRVEAPTRIPITQWIEAKRHCLASGGASRSWAGPTSFMNFSRALTGMFILIGLVFALIAGHAVT